MKKRIVSTMLVFATILTVAGCKKREIPEKLSKRTSESNEDDSEEDEDCAVLGANLTPYSFDESNLPVMRFTYSTSEMAVASTAALLGVSREEAMKILIMKNNDLEEVSAFVDLIPEICIGTRDERIYSPFAADALVFIVNKDNPVDSLTLSQIQKIYAGEIKNWKEVGGNDEEITPFDEGANDVSRKVGYSLVFGGIQKVSPYFRIATEDNLVYDAKATYDNSKNAIGYIEYSSLIGSHWENEVKMLKIEGIEPSREKIASGEYPLQFLLDVAIRKDTDLSSPEGVLYQWMSCEDGRTIAEMAGYIVPDEKPKMSKSYSVSTDDSAFEAVKKESEKITRLSDEVITDFKPSSDYGAVIPFLGVDNQDNGNEGQALYGLMDKNGRIICDPVFDNAFVLEDGSVCVMQYERNTQAQDGEVFRGIISKDGSSYTGLKYNKWVRCDGKTYLGTTGDTGITLYKYDPEKGSVGDAIDLKVGDMTKLYAFDTVIDERFVVCRDFFNEQNWIFDGVTGQDVCPVLSSKCSDWQLLGNFVFGQDIEAANGGSRIFALNGKALSDDFYLSYKSQMPGFYLLGRAGIADDKKGTLTETCAAWDLVDTNGKVLATVPNEDGSVLDVHHVGESLVAVKEDAMDLYDLSGKLIKTVPLKDATSYYIPEVPLNGDNDEMDQGKRLPVFCHCGDNTELVNLETEKTETIPGDYGCVCAGESILLKSYSDNSWKLLNASDFMVIAEGEGNVDILKDNIEQKLYLVSEKSVGRFAFEAQLIDPATGNTVLAIQSVDHDGFVHISHIVSGNVIYPNMQFSCEGSYVCDRVTTVNMNGEVLMRYNTVGLPRK